MPARPEGSANPGDIDTLQLANNNATIRLLDTYREGLTLSYSTAAQLGVSAGSIWCQNTAGTVYKQRKLSTGTTIPWSDIDTGTEANSTTYYVYAVGDSDSAIPTFKISTSGTSPTGVTYYKRLGLFDNDAVGNIVNIKNDNSAYQTYNSGWFSVAVGTDYTKAHNLGTQNLTIDLYFSENSDGANATLIDSLYQPTGISGTAVFTITPTSLTIGTSPTYIAGRYSGGTWTAYSSGYCRVIATAIDK